MFDKVEQLINECNKRHEKSLSSGCFTAYLDLYPKHINSDRFIMEMNSCIDKYPNDYTCRLYLADHWYQLKDYESSIASYLEIKKRNANKEGFHGFLYSNIALNYKEMNDQLNYRKFQILACLHGSGLYCEL